MTGNVTMQQLATILQVELKTLRLWEDEFKEFIRVNPNRYSRKYNEKQVETFLKIKELLQTEMYTIAGAKRRMELDRTLSSAISVDHNFKTTVVFMFSAIMQELQASREESRKLGRQLEAISNEKTTIEAQLLEEQNKSLLEFLRGKIKKGPEDKEEKDGQGFLKTS